MSHFVEDQPRVFFFGLAFERRRNKVFKLVGTSFDFKEGKTEKLHAAMSVQEKSRLILFTDGYVPIAEERRGIVREMGLVFGRKKHVPSLLVKLLFPANSQKPEIPLPVEYRKEDTVNF